MKKKKRTDLPNRFARLRWLSILLVVFIIVYLAAKLAVHYELEIARFYDNVSEGLSSTNTEGRKSDLIAFACTDDGRYSKIYTIRPDGTHLTLVHDVPEFHHGDIAWSPDGAWIAANIRAYGGPQGAHSNEIYRFRFDGSGLRRMTYNQVREYTPQWSSDGSSIWLRDGAGLQQVRVNGHLAREVPIVNLRSFAVTSDGKRLAYVTSRDSEKSKVYVMNADGSDQRLLANESRNIDSIRWAPDNQHLAYFDAFLTLTVADADSLQKDFFFWIDVSDLAWSPEGRWIAFGGSEDYGSSFSLYLLDTVTGEKQIILTAIGSLSGISWSPDGDWIAFSNRNSNYQLHKVKRDGTALQRLTNLGCSAWDATWSPG